MKKNNKMNEINANLHIYQSIKYYKERNNIPQTRKYRVRTEILPKFLTATCMVQVNLDKWYW